MGNRVTNDGDILINNLNMNNSEDELTKYVVSDLEGIVESLKTLETKVNNVQVAVNNKKNEIAAREAARRKAEEEALLDQE